jgi:predicted transcriptional regulator
MAMPMTDAEIATELGISEVAVRATASKALKRIHRAGLMNDFSTIVYLTRRADAGQKYTYIRAGSIECRPEKWVYYAQR